MKQAKPATKSLNLPKPIAAYFAADRGDGEAVSQCFTDNAIVKDEGHAHRGRAAIEAWKIAQARGGRSAGGREPSTNA